MDDGQNEGHPEGASLAYICDANDPSHQRSAVFGGSMMTVKDILPDKPVDVEERTYGPNGEDILFGICSWDCKNLIPCDGDLYSVNECVMKHEFIEDRLTYWIHTEWGG